MDAQTTEAELQGKLVTWFGRWFDVFFEVRSQCGKFRIDLLMYHQSDTERKYPIGIEIKKVEIKRGTDIGKWCEQASNYTRAVFDDRKCHIFTAPQISGWYIDEGSKMAKHPVEREGMAGCHNNVNSFLYRSFGFGELQKFISHWPKKKDHFRLVINTLQVWSSKDPYFLNTPILDKL